MTDSVVPDATRILTQLLRDMGKYETEEEARHRQEVRVNRPDEKNRHVKKRRK